MLVDLQIYITVVTILTPLMFMLVGKPKLFWSIVCLQILSMVVIILYRIWS